MLGITFRHGLGKEQQAYCVAMLVVVSCPLVPFLNPLPFPAYSRVVCCMLRRCFSFASLSLSALLYRNQIVLVLSFLSEGRKSHLNEAGFLFRQLHSDAQGRALLFLLLLLQLIANAVVLACFSTNLPFSFWLQFIIPLGPPWTVFRYFLSLQPPLLQFVSTFPITSLAFLCGGFCFCSWKTELWTHHSFLLPAFVFSFITFVPARKLLGN